MNLIAVKHAKTVLGKMRTDPSKFSTCNLELRDMLSEFNIGFSHIGTTPKEQRMLERKAVIAKAKEYLALAETQNPKWPWVAMFEVTLERHGLKPKDAGVSSQWLANVKEWLIQVELLDMETA